MVRQPIFALALARAFAFAACSKDPGANRGATAPRFAFVTNGASEFWTVAAAGVAQAEKETGFEAMVRMLPTGTVAEQKQQLEDALASGVHGIAVSPVDPDNMTALLDDAARRTLLVTHDSDAPKSKRLCFVGIDNYDAGRLAGRMIAEACPNGGAIVLFVANLDQDNARRRRQGIIDELFARERDPARFDSNDAPLRGGKYEIRTTFTDQFDRNKLKDQAQDALNRWPDVACFVGLFEYEPPILLDVVRGAGKLGKIAMVGFDENDATLQGVLDGHLHATVVQDPYEYGRQSMLLLHRLHGEKDPQKRTALLPKGGVLDVPVRALKKADVPAFWQDLKRKTGKK